MDGELWLLPPIGKLDKLLEMRAYFHDGLSVREAPQVVAPPLGGSTATLLFDGTGADGIGFAVLGWQVEGLIVVIDVRFDSARASEAKQQIALLLGQLHQALTRVSTTPTDGQAEFDIF